MIEYDSNSFSFMHLDTIGYKARLDRTMGQIIREAARRWLRTVVVEVPVETGMAKASLLPLGRFLRNVGGLSIHPTREPYYSKTEGGMQSPETGEQRGMDFEIRDDRSNPHSFVYGFYWKADILHYWLSHYYNGPAVPGEEVIEEADRVLWAYIDQAVATRLPAIRDFLIRGEYNWRSGGFNPDLDDDF